MTERVITVGIGQVLLARHEVAWRYTLPKDIRCCSELLFCACSLGDCKRWALASLVPSPSHPSFCLAAMEKKLFFHGCETKAGVGGTGNEARH